MDKMTQRLLFAFLICVSTITMADARQKKPSGIFGQVFFDNNAPTPEGPQSFWMPHCDIVIEDAMTHHTIKTFCSNKFGKFKLGLSPGKYIVYPVKEGYTNN